MGSYPTAFVFIDLQNDFGHPDGVYAKHGLIAKKLPIILPKIVETIKFCKQNKIPTIAIKLTVLTDLEGNAIGIGFMKKLRPFLEFEGFRLGAWGHDLLEELPPVDYQVNKWGTSSFYNTNLEHYLLALETKEIVVAGFSTNLAIETLGREATGRNYKVTTLTDCVCSYSEALHEASLINLSLFGDTPTSKEWMKTVSSS